MLSSANLVLRYVSRYSVKASGRFQTRSRSSISKPSPSPTKLSLGLKTKPQISKRYYSSQDNPLASSMPEGISYKKLIEKADELALQAAKLNDSGDYASAEHFMEGALTLRTKAIAEYSKENAIPEEHLKYMLTDAKLQVSLAYSKQALGKYADAMKLYEKCLPVIETYQKEERDRGVALLNYAELLFQMKQVEDAVEQCQTSIKILKKYHKDDEVIGAAVGNLAGYLCSIGRYSEAKPPAGQSLKILINKLGKKNEMTRAAWSNYYCILKELKLDEEARDLEIDWKTLNQVSSEASAKVSEKQMEDIRRKVEERYYATKRAEPIGTVKDTTFYKDELKQFIDTWKEKGLDIDDPAHATTLRQELNAIRRGKKQAKNVLEREAEILANTSSAYGEDWSSILEELKSIEDTAASVDATLYEAKQERAKKLAAERTANKKPKGPTPEMKETLARIVVEKKERAIKREEAAKAAAEAAAKAAAEAAAKSAKGKKKGK